jgi:hypothetical protein
MNKLFLLVVLSFALLALFSISQASLYSNALIRLAHQSELLEEEFDDYLYELQSSTYTGMFLFLLTFLPFYSLFVKSISLTYLISQSHLRILPNSYTR